MNMIKNLIAKLIGKQVANETAAVITVPSKTKITAVIYVVVLAVQELSKAWGHPIIIPDFIFRLLEGMGLWSLRSALPDGK